MGRWFESIRAHHIFQLFTAWHFCNLGAIRVHPIQRLFLTANAWAELPRPVSPERFVSSLLPPANTDLLRPDCCGAGNRGWSTDALPTRLTRSRLCAGKYANQRP